MTRASAVLVSGSLVFDRIFFYPGRFKDAIIPDKVHIINVSFTVGPVNESYGGTAGNIAYTLSLLRTLPVVIGSLGNDGEPYRTRCKRSGINMRAVQTYRRYPTASFYVITDRDDNQIGAFQPGVLSHESPPTLNQIRGLAGSRAYAIISPGNHAVMSSLARYYRSLGIPYLFDPGQMITSLSPTRLRALVRGCSGFISNDYELSLLLRKLRIRFDRLKRDVPTVITTLGSKGSVVYRSGETTKIRPAHPRAIVDPTGAGDAFRAGFLAGISRGMTPEMSACMGSVSSVYTVERMGTQTHAFSLQEFSGRFQRTFRSTINIR